MAAEHPDEELVSEVIADLTTWLDDPVQDPTSAITGGGAVRVAEQRFAALHDGRPSLLVPSATYGMYAALLAVGVGPGDRVLVPGVDWYSTLSAVLAVGAEPVPVPVEEETGTIGPTSVAAALAGPRGPEVAAVVACHLHGVPVDVPGVRAVLGEDVPVVEDCAQAMGSTWEGAPVGTRGDVSVFGFGPAKAIDVREAGMVTVASAKLHTRMVELTAHPVRQVLAGVEPTAGGGFSMRVSPVAAIRVAVALARWRPALERARHAWLREQIARADPQVVVMGGDRRRANAAIAVPVRVQPVTGSSAALVGTPSGAVDIRRLIAGRMCSAGVRLVRQQEILGMS